MKKSIITLTLISSFVAACGSSSDDGLGTQIDSMGRPAINTALINTFASDVDRGIAEDDYNSTSNFDRTRFEPVIAGQLAIYDSLVGTCGDNGVTNRASANPADGLATGAGRYAFLSAVLADDQLLVNGSSAGAVAGQCNQYLSAELSTIGVAGLEADCGGRTPTYDVIETTYSAVSIGAAVGVDDGVASDNVTHSSTEFPFFAPAS